MTTPGGRDSKHSVHCAFLACGISLLKSGFEEILTTIPKSSSYWKTITSACCKVVLSKEDDIFSSLSHMSKLFCEDCDVKAASTTRVVCGLDIVENGIVSFGSISRDGKGRQLTTMQAVSRGTMLLRDYPYVCNNSSECKCCEESLLIEHIQMAVGIKYNKHRDVKRHNIFLKNVCSGFDFRPNENNSSYSWSDHMTFTMCLTCALITLYALRREANVNAANPHNVLTTPHLKEQLFQQQHLSDCMELIEILGRLPTNVHAVTKIHRTVNDGSPMGALQQRVATVQIRIGYSLYLTASAVNHSCVPNAAIKFTRNNTSVTGLGSSSDLLNELFTTAVEVVTTENLDRKYEACVSYGPLRGVHSLSTRRQTLQSQYLFHCMCSGCTEDQKQEHTQQVAAMLRYAQLTTAQGKLSEQMEKESMTVLDAELLCESLKGFTAEVEDIQRAFNEILHSHSSDQEQRLTALENQRMHKFKSRLETIQAKYFPETLSWMSVPALDCGTPMSVSQMKNSLCSEFCGILLAALDVHAHLLALLHQYSAAAQLVHTAITVMVACGRYRDTDVVVARERVKLAQLQFSAGQRGHCLTTVRRALHDLGPCVSEEDPDWVEASSILSFLIH